MNRSRRGAGMTFRRASLVAFATVTSAWCWLTPVRGADVMLRIPLKAPPADPAFNWTGWYFGGQYGYAGGYSQWNATQAGGAGPPLTGSLDLTNPLNGYFGDGSYFGGLQAGYNQAVGSRLVLGGEADVWFPSIPTGLLGAKTFASPLVGQAVYQDVVAYSGSARGRLGYVLDNNWLLYATSGFAFAYDKLQRTQILGTPASGSAQEGSFQNGLMWRLGWTLGAGVELPIAPSWTAKVEYQYASLSNSSIAFPAGAQVFNSNLALHSVRIGFNYQIGDASKWAGFIANGPTAIEEDRFVLHGQVTYVQQYVPQFRSPYGGPNSLIPNQGRETSDTTFYIGARLWGGAEFWVNPEIDQGFGISNTLGVAGFTSGEAYKFGNDYPYARVPRYFVRQTINLGGEVQKAEAGINQFSGTQTANRLVISAGKLGVADIFDGNRYAHDPRSDFLNWALTDAGTFDYAADAWGYTYGGAIEWYQGAWTLRAGIFDAPIKPNNVEVDPHFNQFQSLFEVEHRHELMGQPGKVAITGWATRARLGNYNDAVALAQLTGQPADIAAVRHYTTRSGIAANLEQQITNDWGIFMRTGLASPNVEPDAFTDIDRTMAVGASFSGRQWGRPDDTWAIAGILNNISTSHQTFFNNGGLGILIGDGQLSHPGLEQILETYYTFPLYGWKVTFDYQFINNPAYNRDRGPVSVFGTRLHFQF
jgi:high affinity Mn2+ porin